jgi:hypothetical protein
MVTGRREAGENDAVLVPAPLWRFILSVMVAAGLTLLIANVL